MSESPTGQSVPLPPSVRALYPFPPHFFTVGEEPHRFRLHYLDEGPRNSSLPPVLLVHGNPSWSFLFRKTIQALSASGRRCLAIDHLGMGLSDKPQDFPYVLQNHIDHLQALVDHLGLERFDMVLHDWGGVIGLGVALEDPERLRRLVLANTAAWHSQRIPKRIRLCKTPLLGDILIRGFNGFAGAAVHMAVAHRVPQEVKQGYIWPYDSWETRVATLRFVQDIPLHADHPTWQTLGAIEARLPVLQKKPVKLFWGMKDFCFDAHFLREWQRRLPKASTTEVAEAGHYVFEEAGEEAQQALEHFLQGS